MQINAAAGGDVTNNTIVQETGECVRVQTGSTGLQVRNNIIEVAGTAIPLAGDSAINFASDYNELYVAGTGQWRPSRRTVFHVSLADWYYEFGQDQHSQTANPLFVDPDGADNLLGYVGGARPWPGR